MKKRPSTLTVWFGGQPLQIHTSIAQRLHLKADQPLLSPEHYQQVIHQNTSLSVSALRNKN